MSWMLQSVRANDNNAKPSDKHRGIKQLQMRSEGVRALNKQKKLISSKAQFSSCFVRGGQVDILYIAE